jgi:hypothetical protein
MSHAIGVVRDPSIYGVRFLPKPKQTAPSFAIGPTLEQFLEGTLGGSISWQHTQESLNKETGAQPAERRDRMTAQVNGMQVTLTGIRPDSAQPTAPAQLREWEMTVTHLASGQSKTLNGQAMYLPTTVSPTTDRTHQTLPKLMRMAYEARGQKHNGLVPVVEGLLKDLKAGTISATSSYIKPNPMFGPPMGVTLIQVGQKDPRLEIAKMGDSLRFTLHAQGKTTKLTEEVLANETLRLMLDELMALADSSPPPAANPWDLKKLKKAAG